MRCRDRVGVEELIQDTLLGARVLDHTTMENENRFTCITSRAAGPACLAVGTSGVTPVPRGASWALVSIYLGTLCIADKTVRRNQKSQMPTGDRAPPREGARELAHEYSKLLSVGMGIW